jgi:hypothetical protein
MIPGGTDALDGTIPHGHADIVPSQDGIRAKPRWCGVHNETRRVPHVRRSVRGPKKDGRSAPLLCWRETKRLPGAVGPVTLYAENIGNQPNLSHVRWRERGAPVQGGNTSFIRSAGPSWGRPMRLSRTEAGRPARRQQEARTTLPKSDMDRGRCSPPNGRLAGSGPG